MEGPLVSTSTESADEIGLSLPAKSTDFIFNGCIPSDNEETSYVQSPVLSDVVSPMSAWSL